ncbi:hypothetical protein [Undibacterium sp.]|uniref:hypothetical protein n=1 Tax=Undibacterium sp. TaxID=1914977 RepID=UPI0025EB9D4D|nr:hypothetical protein [Undibacterium sp.]
MEEQQLLGLLWTMLPSTSYILGSLLFGMVGLVAYRYGKKTQRPRCKWLGVTLMFYPYLIGSDTRLLYLLGTALCAALYVYRNE